MMPEVRIPAWRRESARYR